MSIIFLLLLSAIINAQNISEIVEPKCDGETIKYSIYANLSEYLENVENIDGRELYESLDDLSSKKVGTLKGLYFNRDNFENIIEYDSYDDLIEDLRNYELDAIILNDGLANNIQMFTNDISKFQDLEGHPDIAVGLQKDNETLLNQLNEFISHVNSSEHKRNVWLGTNFQMIHINKTLSGENGTINVVTLENNPPYSYKNKSGELTGDEIEFIYDFAREYGYQINMIVAANQDEEIELLKNKTADIAISTLAVREDKNDDISYSNVIYKGTTTALVRYENLPESVEEILFYNESKDFDGETLGIIKDSSVVNLTKKNFPESNVVYYDGTFEVFQGLLKEEIEGFLIDEPYAEYFHALYPDRLTYFPDKYDENQYGFGFQKTDEGKILLDQFNEFLSKTNTEEIYDKWNVDDTTKLTIDKNLNTSAETLDAGFLLDINPLCFLEGSEIKGYEIDLLYRFAKEYNYNINLTGILLGERVTHIQEGKANITGGWFTINDERKQLIDFSDSIHNAGTVLVTRVDMKEDEIALKILDNNHKEKPNNDANVQVKFSDKIKNCSCVFPEKYNKSIIINCTISDLDNINPNEEGFDFLNTSDKINLLFIDLELSNFFQANSKISGHENIITESDKSNVVCPLNSSSIPTSVPSTNSTTSSTSIPTPTPSTTKPTPTPSTTKPTPTPEPSPGSNEETAVSRRKPIKGLSTGAIIAIIIPCAVVLIAAIIAAIVCVKRKSDSESAIINESNNGLNIKN